MQNKTALVLGLGGSGRSSALALKQAGATVYAYRRDQAELEEDCIRLGVTPAKDIESGHYDIIVNCTGVGMHESEGKSPVSERAFANATWAVDLIYVPEQSKFLQLAKDRGVHTLNGKSMLFYQAYFADCLYLGRPATVEEAKALYAQYLEK